MYSQTPMPFDLHSRDNAAARGADPSGLGGNSYVGTAELFTGPLRVGYPGLGVGDEPQGKLRSAPFTLTGNRIALYVSAPLVALQLLLTYEPTLQSLFATAALDAAAWALIVALALAKFLAVELEKAVLRRLGVVRL